MCNVCNQHTPFVCFGILAGSFNLLQSGLHCCGLVLSIRDGIYFHTHLKSLPTFLQKTWIVGFTEELESLEDDVTAFKFIISCCEYCCFCGHSSNIVNAISLPQPKVAAFSSFLPEKLFPFPTLVHVLNGMDFFLHGRDNSVCKNATFPIHDECLIVLHFSILWPPFSMHYYALRCHYKTT